MAIAPPSPGTIAAPHVIGLMLSWGFYGALVVQVYLYYLAFPKDRIFIKAFVYGLFALETAQTAIVSHDGIIFLGVEFANPAQLDLGRLSWLSVPFMSSIVSTSVQLFFAWRIQLLSRSWIIAILVAVLALFSGSTGIAQAIISYKLGRFSLIQQKTHVTFTMWLASTALCDVVIAMCMSYFLSRRRTGMRQTDAIVTRLIRLSIETGTLTAILAVIDMSLVLGRPNDDFFVSPSYVLAKIYSNNFLMILNSRFQITGGRNASSLTDPSMEVLSMTFQARAGPSAPKFQFESANGQRDTRSGVHIDVAAETYREDPESTMGMKKMTDSFGYAQ